MFLIIPIELSMALVLIPGFISSIIIESPTLVKCVRPSIPLKFFKPFWIASPSIPSVNATVKAVKAFKTWCLPGAKVFMIISPFFDFSLPKIFKS